MTRRPVGLVLLLAFLVLPLCLRAAPTPPSLVPLFGPAADREWTTTGHYTLARDDKLGRSVLTVGAAPLTLDSKAPAGGAREVRVLVRLRTVPAGSASAALVLGRGNGPDQSVRLTVSTS